MPDDTFRQLFLAINLCPEKDFRQNGLMTHEDTGVTNAFFGVFTLFYLGRFEKSILMILLTLHLLDAANAYLSTSVVLLFLFFKLQQGFLKVGGM